MSFELPALPYAMDALEPYISAKTMEFHYGNHLYIFYGSCPAHRPLQGKKI